MDDKKALEMLAEIEEFFFYRKNTADGDKAIAAGDIAKDLHVLVYKWYIVSK